MEPTPLARILRDHALQAREDADIVRNPAVKRDLRRSAAAFDAMAEAEERRLWGPTAFALPRARAHADPFDAVPDIGAHDGAAMQGTATNREKAAPPLSRQSTPKRLRGHAARSAAMFEALAATHEQKKPTRRLGPRHSRQERP